jgi:hypothetical protein
VREPFTLASWTSSRKHLVKHDLLLSTPATNAEAFFQAMKMEDEMDARFVLSEQLVDPKDVAKFGQRRGLWLSAAQYHHLVDDLGARPEDFVTEERADGKKWKKRVRVRAAWDVMSFEVMAELLRIKFDATFGQPAAVRVMEALTALFSGKPVMFVEHTGNDSNWGNGLLGSGANKLGLALFGEYQARLGLTRFRAARPLKQMCSDVVLHRARELRPRCDTDAADRVADEDRFTDSLMWRGFGHLTPLAGTWSSCGSQSGVFFFFLEQFS